MSRSSYREGLPPMPRQIAKLHVDRGYPVPWFVPWLVDDVESTQDGIGRPEFRLMSERKLVLATKYGRCWVCGVPLSNGREAAFVIGPMCAVTRTSGEPPSHLECARWSAVACPFLSRPKMVRREGGEPLPEEAYAQQGALMRNPGVAMVWVSKAHIERQEKGFLFKLHDPSLIECYAEGRAATPAEIEASIEAGLPALEEIAVQQRGGTEELSRRVASARELLAA